MEYILPSTYININDYEYIVSIGNKCPTAMILRELNIYKESFPFDYIPSSPSLILKYLKDNTDYFPEKNIVRNKDGVWFGHFDINLQYEKTIETFKRRFNRLFDILDKKKRILFIYTSEADIYNEGGNRYADNYIDILNLCEYIKERYEYDNFTVLAIHTNKSFENTKNIFNYTISVDNIYYSDDMSTHIPSVFNRYRSVLKSFIKDIFQI
jgi:hypothetical protein